MNQELYQIDEFTVVRKQLLSLQQLEVLNKLYIPLLSMETVGFYQYLYQLPKTFAQATVKATHTLIMNDLSCRLDYILTHRHKLEALGLLKVYVKMQTPQQFIYEIVPPLSAEEFFNNALLYTLLSERISETRTLQLKQQLLIPTPDYSDYNNITKKIDDIYSIKNLSLYHKKESEIIKSYQEEPISSHRQFDWLGLIQLLGDNFITEQQLTEEVKKTVQDIFILYNTTIIDMKNILLSSLNQFQQVDIDKLKNNARQYYKFYSNNVMVDNDTTPVLSSSASKKEQLCYYYDTHSPVMVLIQRFNAPVSEDVQQSLEKITEKYQLPQGVMNVLCDYCLQQTKKTVLPNYKYLDKVAADFSTQHLKDAKEAMLYVIQSKKKREQSREQKQRANLERVNYGSYQKTYKKQEPLPQYMKQLPKQENHQDEQYIEEVKNLINRRGDN